MMNAPGITSAVGASGSQPAWQAMRPDGMLPEEWAMRIELAACYRLFSFLGWTEMIFNHITLRVPGGEASNPHYLINPYGLHYNEVSASNLIKIDALGNIIGESDYPVNPAGFTIHSVIHAARPDAHCIMHTHTTAGMAVACKAEGLKYENFYTAMLHGQVAYHRFEGITTDLSEGPRLVASLGQKNVLILRNHGLLVCGHDVPGALQMMWTVQRGCEIQMATDSMQGANQAIDPEVFGKTAAQRRPLQMNARPGEVMFKGMLRRAGIVYEELV
jgi:ribulose-5-phosphate 4-epimerase/fuculose-1-phosphate aldolase